MWLCLGSTKIIGSCHATRDVFIREDLLSYPWLQLSEIQAYAHIFSLQAENRGRNRLYRHTSQILLGKGLPDLQEKTCLGTVMSDAATLVFIYGQITFLQDIFFISFCLLFHLHACLDGNGLRKSLCLSPWVTVWCLTLHPQPTDHTVLFCHHRGLASITPSKCLTGWGKRSVFCRWHGETGPFCSKMMLHTQSSLSVKKLEDWVQTVVPNGGKSSWWLAPVVFSKGQYWSPSW